MIHVMHNGHIRITHANQALYNLKFRVPPHTHLTVLFPGCYVTGPAPLPLRTYRHARRTYAR